VELISRFDLLANVPVIFLAEILKIFFGLFGRIDGLPWKKRAPLARWRPAGPNPSPFEEKHSY
jgi:hypothetical protein